MIDRLDPQQLRDRLYDAKFWSKKDLGQHFLIDRAALMAVVEAGEITPTDTVIEIGPGLGVLTEQLVERAGRVITFELDLQMIQVLQEDFLGLEIIPGNVLETAPPAVNELGKYKIVANIPYQITTPLLRLFLEGGVTKRPDRMVLLVQKEVAERLAAPAGNSDRGYLSVVSQYFSQVEYIRTVSRTCFWPAPAVDSAVISFQSKQERPFDREDEVRFLKYVKAAYSQPRKQLRNVLAGMRGVSHQVIGEQFSRLGIADTARAQELTEKQWIELFKAGV